MGKRRKTIIISAIIILAGAVCACLGFMFFSDRQDDKYIKTAAVGDISRYEWMEMLCEQSGLTEYNSAAPYYEDVNADSPYFPYIQSAVEWNVLAGDAEFAGDGYASGRFVALTAMKSLGERKLMTYLETEDALSDDRYLKLAMEHGLIEKDKLAEGVSEEECERILENLQGLYFGEFWRDDYSHIVYQDGVIELLPDQVIRSNVDGTEIVVSDSASDTLETGNIIVFEEKNTKLKYARRINGKAPDGTLSLSPVELEQAVESFTVSDIMEVTFEDIVKSYASEDAYSLHHIDDWQDGAGFIETKFLPEDFSGNVSHKGYKITLSTEDNENDKDKHLEIEITDHETGRSMMLPIGDQVKLEGDYSVELDIDKILIGAQADYNFLGGVQYADVAVDIDSTFKGEIKAEEEVKLPLFKTPTPIPLVSGIAGVDIQLYLVFSTEGMISIEAELPVGVSVVYEQDKGIRRQKQELQPGRPEIEANCDASAMFRFEPVLVAFGGNIIDVEADIGMAASAQIATRKNAQVCAETEISFPVFMISVLGDEDADALIGLWVETQEWEIITSDNAPVHINTHFELLPDGTGQFVEACTYQEKENEAETGVEEEETAEAAGDMEQPEDASLHTYYTQKSDTKFAFDYPDGWSLDAEESSSLSNGFKEAVVFKNDRGVLLQYWEQMDNYALGGRGHDLCGVEVTKAADSSLEGFIVGKIKSVSVVEYPSGEERPLEDDDEMYAVIPQDHVGTDYYGGAYYADYLSFAYGGSTYYFSASAPYNESLTEEEEKEVIAILSSFREVQ